MDRYGDSTSTKPSSYSFDDENIKYNQPEDFGQSESEGLGYAMGNMFETGARMFNPTDAIIGVGEGISGAMNDVSRAFGGSPPENAPSFVGSLKEVGKQFSDNPFQATFDMATSPGSIPALAAGASLPKIPKGTGYNAVSPKPGTRVVREKLKGVGVFDYIPDKGVAPAKRTHKDIRMRRSPENYYNSNLFRQAQTKLASRPHTILDIDKYDPKNIIKKDLNNPRESSFDGIYYPSLDSILKPRKNHQYKYPDEFHATTNNKHKVDPKWSRDIERHESIHALNNKGRINKLPKVVRPHVDEASAYTGHYKSLTEGLDHMGNVYSRGNYGNSAKFLGPAILGASKVMKAARKPGMLTGAVPYLANPYEEEYK
jgi:hypothetical protein